MKNFKQVIAPLLLAICVAGTAMFVNASWSDPTCSPTSCNRDPLISTSSETQFKDGSFSSIGFTDVSSIVYDGIIASMTNIESAGRVTVGTSGSIVTNSPNYDADFRVVHGNSWFKNPVSVGDQTVTQTSVASVSGYDLVVKGNTNIGLGDYCTLRANQLENETTGICPTGGTFGPSFMNWYRVDAKNDPTLGVNAIAAHCGKLAPTTNSAPQDLGSCYTTPPPTIVSSFKTRTGPGLSYNYLPPPAGVSNQTAMCATKDDYTLTSTFSDNDATPLVYVWQSRSKIGSGGTWSSWADVSNSNSSSINISVDKSGTYPGNLPGRPVYYWEYKVKLTDSLTQTSGFTGGISVQSVNRTNTYVDYNGNTQPCP